MSDQGSNWQVAIVSAVASFLASAVVALFVLGLVYAKDVRDATPRERSEIRAACGWCGRACPYCRASYPPGQLGDVKK